MINQPANVETTRIAIIGAGPAGLTAAHTLKKLGYRQVTVYEKEGMPGGKVRTDQSLGWPIELGAVFALESYTVTLGLANELGVPVYPWVPNSAILDEDGTLLTSLQLASRKYGLAQLKEASDRYSQLSDAYRINDRRGFAGLPVELHMPFAQYAVKFGILPIAEMLKCRAVAYGYPYYENVPAMYYFKLFDLLLKVDPAGLQTMTILLFPAGFQNLWVRLAEGLDVHCSSEVTRIQRSMTGSEPKIEITANGAARVYDRLIIASPPKATQQYLDMTNEERELFARVVSRNYHVTVAKVAGMGSERRTLMPYANTRPEAIGHVNAWYDPSPTEPVFAAYQNVDWSQKSDEARRLLTQDFATFGGGMLEGVLLHKEWDFFPHVEMPTLADGFYDRFEALQGANGTFYAGGLLSSDSVEHAARYARDLVTEFFAPAALVAVGSPTSIGPES